MPGNNCLGHPVYNIYLHRISNNFIIKALMKIFIYFERVPKNSKIRHLRKKLNILRRRHFVRKLPFLVAYISPGSGGLSTIRPFQSTSPKISLNFLKYVLTLYFRITMLKGYVKYQFQPCYLVNRTLNDEV